MRVNTINEKTHILSKRHIMIAVALFVCFLWGSAYPSIVSSYILLNINTADVPQVMLFAGIRFLIAATLIFIYAFLTKRSMKINIKGFFLIAILGLLQTFGQYIFFFLGLRFVHPANGSIVSSLGIFMTVLIAHFFYKTDRLTTKKVCGFAIGIVGIIILNGGATSNFTFFGEGFLFLAALFGAIAGVYTKKLTTTLSPYVITGYQLLIGSILLIIVGSTLATDIEFTFTSLSTSILIYLGFVSAAGFTLWSSLLKHNKVSRVSIYRFLIPVFSVLLSFIFLQVSFDVVNVLIALAFVASGIVLINME